MSRARGSGRPPSQRQLRVGEAVRHALVDILGRGELRDPELSGVLITVSEVRVSPDLKNATAFVSPLGGEAIAGSDPAVIAKALRRASAFLRGQLARELDMRHIPSLSFEPDRSFDEASHIDAVLRRPRVQQDLEEDEDAGADEEEAAREPGDDGESRG